ncbi:MAG: hypothetical protein H7258_11755 [Ferruginibacter sp.]|nr:hypothetical protein [Ferruginibacter sp.]
MIAYNKTWLQNKFIQEHSFTALGEYYITQEEQAAIKIAYPAPFYTPNLFIRIGLFLLTGIIMIFTFGLLALICLNIIERAAGGLAVFFGMASFAILEYFIKIKKHFRSGVDDALCSLGAVSVFSGIFLPSNMNGLSICWVIFIITLFCSLRYADRLMASGCMLALLGIFFFTCTLIGGDFKAIVPFVIMVVSLIIYITSKILNDKTQFYTYGDCLQIIEIVSLISLYLAGNYGIVRELSNTMFDLRLAPAQSIPFGFVFWILTVALPLLYLALGAIKRDLVLLRVGLVLVAAIVFTVRYYHDILNIEVLVTIAGLVMIIFAWALTRYLRFPKHGFSSRERNTAYSQDKLSVESLALAETFSPQPALPPGTEFGGGSFGGGGASGDF